VDQAKSVRIARDSQNSTISPTTASFDKSNPADVTVTVTYNGNTLSKIKNGSNDLSNSTDYTISGNDVTIKKEYLINQTVGSTTLTFEFSAGNSASLVISISDTAPVVPPTVEDDAVTKVTGITVGTLTDGKIDIGIGASVLSNGKYIEPALTDIVTQDPKAANGADTSKAYVGVKVVAPEVAKTASNIEVYIDGTKKSASLDNGGVGDAYIFTYFRVAQAYGVDGSELQSVDHSERGNVTWKPVTPYSQTLKFVWKDGSGKTLAISEFTANFNK
jgi:hypothetical protein